MTPAATALALLIQSRDAEHDAPIWHDNGRTVTRLAQTAGTRVTYVHVDLTALTTERRTVGETSEHALAPERPEMAQKRGRAGREGINVYSSILRR